MTETYFNNRIPAISKINIKNRINAHGIDINNVVYNSKLLVIPCPTTIVNEKGREFLPFVKVFHYKKFDSLYPLPKSLINSFEYIINCLKNNKVKQNKMYWKYRIFLGTPFYNSDNGLYFSDINSAVIMAIMFNINTIYSRSSNKNIKINKKLLPLMYMYNIIIQDIDDDLVFNSENIDTLNKSGKNLEFIKNYHTNLLAKRNFLYKNELDDDITLYKFKRMTEYLNKKIQLVYSEKIDKQTVYFRGANSTDLIYPDTHSVTNYIQRAMAYGETIFIIVEDPGHYCFDIDFKQAKNIEYFSEINWDHIDYQFEYIMPPTIYHEIEKVNKNVIIISSNKDIKITEKNREIINKSIQTYNEIMKPYDLKDRRFILSNASDFYKSFIKDIIDGIVETDVYYKIDGPFYIVEEQLEPNNKIFVNGFSYCNEKKCVNTFDYTIFVEFDALIDLSVYFKHDSNNQRKIPVYYTYNDDKHVEYFFKVTKVKSKEITITISRKNI